MEWVNFELHPETPPEGVLLKERFPGADMRGMLDHLRRSGRDYGLAFGDLTWLSNSRLALQAGFFAREHGCFHDFHARAFRAYFTETLDIGNREVLLNLAADVGLDRGELDRALTDGRHVQDLRQAADLAGRMNVTAVPTFLFDGGARRIVGTQPLKVFREALTGASSDAIPVIPKNL